MTTASTLRRLGRRALKAGWWASTPWRMPARLQRRQDVLARLADGDRPTTTLDDAYAAWLAAFPPVPPPAGGAGPLPAISLLVPAAAADADTVATLDSIAAQDVPGWTAVLPATRATATFHPGHAGIVRVRCGSGGDRGALLAALLDAAPDPFVCVLDPGDRLAPHAVRFLAATLANAPGTALLYADEDAADHTGRRREPFLKPGWSPDTLQAFNYVGRPAVLDRDLARACGVAAGLGDGTEWDLLLRLTAAASDARRAIRRLPGVLCTRPSWTARERPRPDTDAAEQRRRALHAHLLPTRPGLRTSSRPDGTVAATWSPPAPADGRPLVSAIVPARSAAAARRLLHDLLDGTDEARLEAVLVPCGPASRDHDAGMAALLAELAALPAVRTVLPGAGRAAPGTIAAAWNEGARQATGAVLLFLHEDTAPAAPGWLSELVRTALLPGVGPVGAMLLTPDGGVRHGGMAAGPGVPGPVFRSGSPPAWGVFGAPTHPRTWSAVSGACLAISRAAFDLVGEFDEGFSGLSAGPALCLRAGRFGFRTVCVPAAPVVFDADTTADDIRDMPRLAAALRQVRGEDDLFFHPALSGHNPVPTLRVPGEPGGADVARAAEARLAGSVPPGAPLDLFDDIAVLAAVADPQADVLPVLDATRPVEDVAAAASWVVGLLRHRPDLRARFPLALTEGRTGGFARWLSGAPLPRGMAAQLDAMWDADPGARPRQILYWRDDVRAAHPAALLPPGRAAIVGYLFRDAPREYGLRPDEAWWFLLACAEDPAGRLVQCYRFDVSWQEAHPLGLTVFGRDALADWARRRFGVSGTPAWLDPARWPGLPDAAEQLRLAWAAIPAWRQRHPDALASPDAAAALLAWLENPGAGLAPAARDWCRVQRDAGTAAVLGGPAVNVLGHFCYPSGLRVSAETMSDAMEAAGVAVSRRDIRLRLRDDPPHADFGGLESAPITIVHTQPVELFLRCHERADLRPRTPRTYRIGYWYWELDQVPVEWAEAARETDELWAATGFVAEALRRTVDVPVRVMFPGVRLPAFTRRPREVLGAPARGPGAGRFAFLFSFHMASVAERKNPLGLIRAFKAAFDPAEPVDLVLKTTSGDEHPEELAALRREAGGANVTVIDRVFTPDETLSLVDACDAYVSLHRAEGLGLTMAEAMLLAKPVIATRYSGNLHFMDDGNSLLVDCAMTRLERPIGPYPAGASWADPSEEHAARLMRQLVDDRAAAATLGERARASALRSMSLADAGAHMAARLREIMAGQPAH